MTLADFINILGSLNITSDYVLKLTNLWIFVTYKFKTRTNFYVPIIDTHQHMSFGFPSRLILKSHLSFKYSILDDSGISHAKTYI